MPVPIQNRILVTVAELRAALAPLDPTLLVVAEHPPFDGIQLVVDARRVLIRSPKNTGPKQ